MATVSEVYDNELLYVQESHIKALTLKRTECVKCWRPVTTIALEPTVATTVTSIATNASKPLWITNGWWWTTSTRRFVDVRAGDELARPASIANLDLSRPGWACGPTSATVSLFNLDFNTATLRSALSVLEITRLTLRIG